LFVFDLLYCTDHDSEKQYKGCYCLILELLVRACLQANSKKPAKNSAGFLEN
jgi:hypothetical protein